MALFYLINNVKVGTHQMVAGSLVNDAVEDAATMRACGGVLCPSSNAAVAAAAAIAQSMRARGQELSEIADVMQAAYEQQAGADELRLDGTTQMTAAFAWAATAATAGMSQAAKTTVGTGVAMAVRAQAATAIGAGANVGGALTVGGGNTSGGVGSNTGGATTVDTGAGATANGELNFATGGVTRLTLAGVGTTLTWAATVATIGMGQTNLGAGGTAAAWALTAQRSAVNGGANIGGDFAGAAGSAANNGTGIATGGAMVVNGGDAAQTANGVVVTTGGDATFRAGNATGFGAGAGGATVGGNLNLAAGNAATGLTNTGGNAILASGAGATAVGTVTVRTGGVGGTVCFTADATGIGFYAHATVAQQTVIGAKVDTVAGNLVVALAALGLIINNTT
jgi:hypothetical protein